MQLIESGESREKRDWEEEICSEKEGYVQCPEPQGLPSCGKCALVLSSSSSREKSFQEV